MVNFTTEQMDFLRNIFNGNPGLEFTITIKLPGTIVETTTISTRDSQEEINNKITGGYLESPSSSDDPYSGVEIGEIFEWNRSYKPDAAGWISLFNQENDVERCRWFMKLEGPDNRTSSRYLSTNVTEISLYRKEDQLVHICTIKRYGDGLNDPYHITIESYITKHDCIKSFNDNDRISSCDVKFKELFGSYDILIANVLFDIIMCIRNGGYRVDNK